MDATLLTILVLLVLATVVAIVQAQQRDRCLKSFEDDSITLAEEGGDIVWGRARLYTTGLELRYAAPVEAVEGHVEQSFMFYKEEYPKIEALFRVPEGLTAEEQASRRQAIKRTAKPGFFRRTGRKIRNWFALVRDAVVQSAGLIIGFAKARRPGLASQEANIQKLTSEIVGYAGTAYDPLLEAHLFTQVVVEVTFDSGTRSYCGWLKNYTANFLEIVDAFGNEAGTPDLSGVYTTAHPPEDVEIVMANTRLHVTNRSRFLYYVAHAEVAGARYALGCALPPGSTADLTVALPEGMTDGGATVAVTMGLVGRVDLVVPRARALVRHAADGSETRRKHLYVGVENETNRVRAVVEEQDVG